jgi:hypothetical protein
MSKNVYRSSCKVHFLACRILTILELSGQISGGGEAQIQNFMKILPVGAELFQAERRTDGQT